MDYYQRKLIALVATHPQIRSTLHSGPLDSLERFNQLLSALDLPNLSQAEFHLFQLANEVSKASDHANFASSEWGDRQKDVEICHPVSGERCNISANFSLELAQLKLLLKGETSQKSFWLLWRCYPELAARSDPAALLVPSDYALPDSPLFGHSSTVSALVGAMCSPESDDSSCPHLLLFTFSPVQEFIKASRKFLDFWAGSYLLHYWSAQLCFEIAKRYGPDAVITPSLWGQDIIDALVLKEFSDDAEFCTRYVDGIGFDPTLSASLSTAGFPNTLVAVVPETDSSTIGQELADKLRMSWYETGTQVRDHIKQAFQRHLEQLFEMPNDGFEAYIDKLAQSFQAQSSEIREELSRWRQGGCWEWNKLWDVQLQNTWEPYWTTVPIGLPGDPLKIERQFSNNQYPFDKTWVDNLNTLSQTWVAMPTLAEQDLYQTLSVGTWWGNLQARLGQIIQSVKNTRTWNVPVSPGERSSLSGYTSAVHPRLHYHERLREGAGVSERSMRLFWYMMLEVFPGLFNGSERLNAAELTKRMAWSRGGLAASLGIELELDDNELDYERLIRFPNLSSVAAARFMKERPELGKKYWHCVERHLRASDLSPRERHAFYAKTQRPTQIEQVDHAINQDMGKRQNYNGVMFSSKWLGEDMGLSPRSLTTLRSAIANAHRDLKFGESSPADWWVLVLADGDGMGQYISGHKLKIYGDYLVEEAIPESVRTSQNWSEFRDKTRKRMGPATHVGLNRALLDFSNRLVPYLAEKRCCGRVIYSGGDDVMVALPLADLPIFLRSLQAAWCGVADPEHEFLSDGGYWSPKDSRLEGIPNRRLFTMGAGATMSMGIIVAHKSVPLPTVLEQLWSAEKDRAKALLGTGESKHYSAIADKNGLCFRVIYGSGNTLEALMKGHLLESWWRFVQDYKTSDFAPLLYRLADEFTKHAIPSDCDRMFEQVARVVLERRDETLDDKTVEHLMAWLNQWDEWAFGAEQLAKQRQVEPIGCQTGDLAMLLRFTAFWVTRQRQEWEWIQQGRIGE